MVTTSKPARSQQARQTKLQVLPSKKLFYRTVFGGSGSSWHSCTCHRYEGIQDKCCHLPKPRMQKSSSRTPLCEHSPKEHAFLPGALWQSFSQFSKAVSHNPIFPELQRGPRHPSKLTAIQSGFKSINCTTSHTHAATADSLLTTFLPKAP